MKDIIELNSFESLKQVEKTMPEHSKMIEVINKSLPEIHRASSLFMKTQSQFMDNLLTVNGFTPIRNARQILSEITRTREALNDSFFKLKKKENEMKVKLRDLEAEKDYLKKDLLQIEIEEIKAGAEISKGYISGALRRLTNYTEQYNMIMDEYNLHNFNEEDFEKEEERYHIMTAFNQAICAARSRGGLIDEGNMIYLTQLGIGGAGAQYTVKKYFDEEDKLLSVGKEPSFEMHLSFLNAMADRYQGCSKSISKSKGMTPFTNTALLKEGDNRLLENK